MMTMQSGARRCSRSRVSGERIFSGCCRGIFPATAASFTGDAEISWPRPRGRSGCVITAAISMSGCARRWMKVGTAKCGVPQKTMRMRSVPIVDSGRIAVEVLRFAQDDTIFEGAKPSPLALFPELFDFALDQVAFQHAQMLDEENAIKVID